MPGRIAADSTASMMPQRPIVATNGCALRYVGNLSKCIDYLVVAGISQPSPERLAIRSV